MPKAGEICTRCGNVIRATTTNTPMMDGTVSRTPNLTCGHCLEPRGPSDDE